VLGALPKSAHPDANKALAEIWNAEEKDHARAAVKAFAAAYRAKFPKAAAKITEDEDELLAFYDYPASTGVHLRTTDENVNHAAPVPGSFCLGQLAGRRSCLILRLAAVVKVERPAGPNDLDHGEGRGNVGLVAGAADRRAKSRSGDWKACRAA
jgi:hypothetical protein